MKIKILVASHKKYEMPSDLLYLPIWVGKLLHPKYNLEYKGDDTAKNGADCYSKNGYAVTVLTWQS